MNDYTDEKIERYLLSEMTDAEREELENQVVADDYLVHEISDRENSLVDGYVRGELEKDVHAKLEKSLKANPARRQKVANARVLHAFIRNERAEQKTITIAERRGLLARIFSFGPGLQFASAAAMVLLAVVAVFLFTENRRLASLESELASARQRADQLAAEIENERDTAVGLTIDLDAERERIARLEAEIARLQGDGGTNAQPPVSQSPTIATLVLFPIRIRSQQSIRRLDLRPGIERISIVVELPKVRPSGGRFTIRLNGQPVSLNLREKNDKLTIAVPRSRLTPGANRLEVLAGEAPVAEYDFSVNITE